jgi:hypothetical protein
MLAATVPNVTLTVSRKSVPRMTTAVPPDCGPWPGRIDVITGVLL